MFWSWIKKHWRPIASVACTAVAVGALPISPVITAAVGATCTAFVTKKS